MIVAIDFDNTLTYEGTFSKTGKIRIDILQELREMQKNNVIFILYTARRGRYLKEAIKLLDDNNFHPDAVILKPNADFFIDDRACIDGKVDWERWIRKLKNVLSKEKTGNKRSTQSIT